MSKIVAYKCDNCGKIAEGCLNLTIYGNKYYPLGWKEVKQPIIFGSGKHLCDECRKRKVK